MIQDDNLFKGYIPTPPPGGEESPIFTPSGGYQRAAPAAPQQGLPTLRDPLNVQQTTGEIADRERKFEQSMRNEFRALPIVKNTGIILSKAASALNQPDDAGGDLAVMYAFAQTNDPTSVVRESEMELAQRTATMVDQMKAQYNMVSKESRLPKGVRARLLESMRANVRAINDFYGAEYKEARRVAAEKGFNPENITGPYLGDLFRPYEEAYIKRSGGTPRTEAEAAAAAMASPEELAAEPPKAPTAGNLATTKDEPNLEVNVAGALGPRPTAAERAADPALDAKWRRIEAYEAGGPIPTEQIQIEEDKARADALRKRQDETALKLQDALPGSTGGIGAQRPIERRLTNAMSAGMTDEASGIANMFTNPLAPLESYRAGRDVERQRQDEAAAALGWGDLPLAVGGSFLSANPEAIAANLTRTALTTQGAKQGAYGGVLGGFGYGEGAADSAKQAIIGGTAGGIVGGVGGNYAGSRQRGSALDPDLARMSREQDVRISAPMIQGNQQAVNRAGRLESDTGSGEIIQGGFADTASDIGRGVQRVGGGGTVSDDVNLGLNMRGALTSADDAAKARYQAEYKAAEAIDGDPAIEPTDIVAAIDKRIAKLMRRPGANSEAIAELRLHRNDLMPPTAKPKRGQPAPPPQELKLSDIRDLRTELRETIKGGQNRTSGQKKADKAMMEIMDGVNSDIERTLSPEAWAAWKKADASFSAEMTHFKEVTKPIFGDKFDELSPEDIVKRINAAAKGNTQALDRMYARLDPAAQRNLSSTIASNLGKFAGENGEEVFSAARFITQARQLSRQARETLFGPQGSQAFDDLLRLGRRLEFAKSQINVSKTSRGTGNIIRQKLGQILTLALGAGGAGIGGATLGIGGLVAGGTGMVAGAIRRGMQARTMMDPKVTRILADAASASTPQDARQIASRLSSVVARQPEYADELQPMIDEILGFSGKGNKADLTAEDTR